MSNIVYQNMRISGHYDIKQVPDIMITESGYQGIYQGINIVIYGYQVSIRVSGWCLGYHDQGIRLSGIRVSGCSGKVSTLP